MWESGDSCEPEPLLRFRLNGASTFELLAWWGGFVWATSPLFWFVVVCPRLSLQRSFASVHLGFDASAGTHNLT